MFHAKTPAAPQLRHDIAVIGGGFSGLLLTLQVLRRTTAARVFLIERAAHFARGLAYGAADPGHLLNVRAANMSAYPDAPDHFVEWLRQTAPTGTGRQAFVSRQVFGTYLQSLLRASVATDGAAGRLVLVPDEAVAVRETGEKTIVRLGLGHTLHVDQVVLATGNLPPHDPLPLSADVKTSGLYVSDPWGSMALEGLRPFDDVLLLGTGLTAVDMIMRLKDKGHRGRITALSRRGLRPHRHIELGPPPPPFDVPRHLTLTALVRLVRGRARREGWQAAVDGLRPSTQRLWRDASLEERQRFLRHLRPWWDVHRHRVAPPVAERLESLEASGDLEFAKGRLSALTPHRDQIDVAWASGGTTVRRRFAAIINCTGPAGDLRRTSSALLADLFRQGLARADACRLGLDVDALCQVVDDHGRGNPRLFAVGPLSRGAFWEINAVPDIRVQAAELAQRLADVCERRRAALTATTSPERACLAFAVQHGAEARAELKEAQ